MSRDMKVRRYGFERKRKQKKRIITTVVMVLVLGTAAAVGWLAFDPIYDFVTNFHLPAPQVQAPPDSEPQSPDGASQPSPDGPAQEPGKTGGEGEDFPATTAYLPPLMMTEAALPGRLEDLKAQGVQGVVFDLKDAQGRVRYVSGLDQVARNLAQEEDAMDLGWAVRTIRQAGLVPVGRLYAFRDHTAPAHMYDSAVKYMGSKVNWINDSSANGGRPWLNPNDADARQYILDLIGEAADQGLDQVILDGVQFPEGVALHLATYGVTGDLDKSAILADFLTKARARGESDGVTVWPVVNLLSAAGVSDVRYGGSVGRLLKAAGRAVVEVMPDQFGGGVTTETLTLSAPALTPYDTVKSALGACGDVLDGEYEYVAMVQAYTAPNLAASANKPYTKTEVDDQVRAVKEAGISRVLWYSPGGTYP